MSGEWWRRFGDFFDPRDQEREFNWVFDETLRETRYLNEAPPETGAIVRQIDIRQARDKFTRDCYTSFYFYLSPFSDAKFRAACTRAEFRAEEYDIERAGRRANYRAKITIDQPGEKLDKLLKLFNELKEFPPEFAEEITQLFNQEILGTNKGKHLISETPLVQAHVNPVNKDKLELFKIMYLMIKNRNNDKYKSYYAKLKQLLTQGYDPNLIGLNGETLLFLSLSLPPNVMELLLCYGADPSRININYNGEELYCYLVIEVAKEQEQFDHLEVMSAVLTKIKEPQWKVKNIEFSASPGKATTTFTLEDETKFIACLGNVTALTDEQINGLRGVYNSCFEDLEGNEKNLEYNFQSSFRVTEKSTKLVDVIYTLDPDGDSIIVGAVSSEPLHFTLKNIFTMIVIHTEYGFVRESYRRHICMLVQGFGLAYTIPWLIRGTNAVPTIGSYSSLVGYDSYQLIFEQLDVPHTPKYQSLFAREVIKATLEKASGDGEIVSDAPPENPAQMTVREKHPIKVIPSTTKKAKHHLMGKKFFDKNLTGGREGDYLPELHVAGKESYCAMGRRTKKHGIDFPQYTSGHAKNIEKAGLLTEFLAGIKFGPGKRLSFWGIPEKNEPKSNPQRALLRRSRL